MTALSLFFNIFVANGQSLRILGVKRIKTMESERFTGIFTRLQARLHHAASRMLGSDDEAADALQDAFCALWGRRGEIVDERAAEGLAVVSVRNRCLDTLRRRRAHGTVALADGMEWAADTDDSDTRELYHRVDSLIKTVLSERDRRILLLRDYSGWEMADIAAELGLTETNVRVVLSRARRAVAKAYKSASHD